MTAIDAELLAELRSTVELYDADRYPIQHATARFHLGSTLLGAGRAPEATGHLKRAVALFPVDGLPVEHAKATNMLGIAHRDVGDLAGAGEAFANSAAIFAEQGHRPEEAAAHFNRGLVLRDAGRGQEASEAFATAVEVFTEIDARPQAAAASRELGVTLYSFGRLADAVPVLESAIELARRGGDRAGIGTAANVLGIVHLGLEDPVAAREAFHDAAGAHPRTVRPAEYAMARSNLALACDLADLGDHAVLAARQALAVPGGAPEVRAQAQGVLDRRGDDDSALLSVLEVLDEEHRIGALRAEFGRLATDDSAVVTHAWSWVLGLGRAPTERLELAEAWLEVLLEQPSDLFDAVILAAVDAAADLGDGDDEARDLARKSIAQAMGHFHVPQWMRLRDTFNTFAEEHGNSTTWA